MPFEAEIRSLGVELDSYELGRHESVCPRCSAARKPHHQRLKVLGVTIEPGKFYGGCNHCNWTFPEPGFREGQSRFDSRAQSNGSFHVYRSDLRKHRHPFFWQHLNGQGTWDKGTGGIATGSLLYRVDEV